MKKLLVVLLSAALLLGTGLSSAFALVTLNNGLSGQDEFTLTLGQGLTAPDLDPTTSIGFGTWADQVYEWDVFIRVGTAVSSLSDTSVWTETSSADLDDYGRSYVSTTGLEVQVTASLPYGSNTLVTNYNVINDSGGALSDISLFQYLDPDLGFLPGNDSASIATVGGETMLVASDYISIPGSSIGLVNGGTNFGLTFAGWEIDSFASLRTNILSGTYNLTDSILGSNPFDVTMALQYDIGSLANAASAQATTELVANPVPEPGTLLLLGGGLVGLAYLRKRKKA